MPLDDQACYRALVARDARFDGVFFVGVRTTGIYCRPVCRARTPRAERCVFFAHVEEAERDGFRACFRCRPERAPGSGSDSYVSRTVGAAVARIEAGALNDGDTESLARELGVTSRHLRRCTHAELGVSPLDLAITRKLALARELLHGSSLSVTDVAFASGFRSVRRFNDAFRTRHGRSPRELRKHGASSSPRGGATLTLDYRPPYDWRSLLAFLAARAVAGVEAVVDGAYVRSVGVGGRRGCDLGWPRRDASSRAVARGLAVSLARLSWRSSRGCAGCSISTRARRSSTHTSRETRASRRSSRRGQGCVYRVGSTRSRPRSWPSSASRSPSAAA